MCGWRGGGSDGAVRDFICSKDGNGFSENGRRIKGARAACVTVWRGSDGQEGGKVLRGDGRDCSVGPQAKAVEPHAKAVGPQANAVQRRTSSSPPRRRCLWRSAMLRHGKAVQTQGKAAKTDGKAAVKTQGTAAAKTQGAAAEIDEKCPLTFGEAQSNQPVDNLRLKDLHFLLRQTRGDQGHNVGGQSMFAAWTTFASKTSTSCCRCSAATSGAALCCAACATSW